MAKTNAEVGDSIFFACGKQEDVERITSLARDKIGKDLGLIDGIGHLETVITEKFGEDVKLKKLERKRGLFSKFGKASIDSIFDTIYEKIVYSKFRL